MNKNYDYDVIIIGGGPAGSTLGRVLGKEGKRVIILDKRKQLGIPVKCGEVLGEREVLKQNLTMPRGAISTEILGARIEAPDGTDIIWKDEETRGWTLERKIFDQWLNELATDAGAKTLVWSRVIDLIRENGKIVGVIVSHKEGEPYELRAPMIVSAEGMEALIARKAGFNTVHRPYDVDTCYEYEMKSYDHENLIELLFGNERAPRGYIWLFPKANKKVNVGIGIGGSIFNGMKRGDGSFQENGGKADMKMKGCDPKTLLDNYIAEHDQLKDASIMNEFGGVISVGAPMKEFSKDNFMVIGTGAKQVDPIHGGGIALAMESGLMAGEVILKALENDDFSEDRLKEFDQAWFASPGKKCAERLLLRKVTEKLSDDDLNYIFKAIDDKLLNQVMKGNFISPVAKVLGGRPQLLKVLSALTA